MLFQSYSDRSQVVTGAKEFEGKVFIQGNLQCLEDRRNSFLTLKDNQIINTKIEFTTEVRINGDLEVTELVSGYSLSDIVAEALTYGKDEVISGEWVFPQGVTFKDQVIGKSLLDGHELGELVDNKKYEALTAEEGVRSELSAYEEKCRLLDAIYAQVATSPIRLEFFESHQQTFPLKVKVSFYNK